MPLTVYLRNALGRRKGVGGGTEEGGEKRGNRGREREEIEAYLADTRSCNSQQGKVNLI